MANQVCASPCDQASPSSSPRSSSSRSLPPSEHAAPSLATAGTNPFAPAEQSRSRASRNRDAGSIAAAPAWSPDLASERGAPPTATPANSSTPGEAAGAAGGDPACQGSGPRSRHDVEVRPNRRRCRGVGRAFLQPVAREARHDAAADERDEHEHRGKPKTVAQCRSLRKADRVEVDERELPPNSNVSAPSIGRLRQFRPARSSRDTTARNSSGKARSRMAALTGAASSTASRPTIQVAAKTARGPPWSGRRPVQFGIAVRRKPRDRGEGESEDHLVHMPERWAQARSAARPHRRAS